MQEKIKILFVCHGNICRSPMCEFVMKDLVDKKKLTKYFDVSSCATSSEDIGNDIHYGTKEILKEYNIPFQKRKARKICEKDFEYFDYIIVMDESNIRDLNYSFSNKYINKISKLLDYTNISRDIKDPWWTGNFKETYDDVLLGCNALFNYIIKNVL